MEANYSLGKVKKLVEAQLDSYGEGNFVCPIFPNKSINSVVKAFRILGKNISLQKAMEYILYTILNELEENNFKESTEMILHNMIPADVYLLSKDNINWYIKFSIQKNSNKELLLFSFHPTDRDGQTTNGTIYKSQEDYL